MNSSDKNVDRLAHKIRDAMEGRKEDGHEISGDHIAAMRLWEVCGGERGWTESEKAHLDSCVCCRTREKRVRDTLSRSKGQPAAQSAPPVIEVALPPEGGLVTGEPNSDVTDEVHGKTTVSTGASLEVTLRRAAQGASQDELHLTLECEDARSVARLLSLDIAGSEGVVNSFLMLAPGESGVLRSYRKWNTSLVSRQVGENIGLWLKEKSLGDVGVFESELLPEAARLAGPEERRIWLAFAEAAMLHVSPSDLGEDEILSSFASSDLVLRMHAALVSGRISVEAEGLIQELIKRLRDAEEAVRYAAVVSLGAVKLDDAVEPLLSCLKDEPLIRRAVAKALGHFDSEASIAALAKLLHGDLQVEVCQSACQALGRLGSDAAVKNLFGAVKKSPNYNVQNAAYQALSKIESVAAKEALSGLQEEGAGTSLPDFSAGAMGVLGPVFAENELVPAFLLPALYGTAVAALAVPMDTLASTGEALRDRGTTHAESSSIYSVALGDTETASIGPAGPVQQSEWPVEKWKCTDDARRTLTEIEGAARLLAEWSSGNLMLSVWLEGAEGVVDLLAVEWLGTRDELWKKAAGDRNGICELQSEHSPTSGDYLRATVKTVEEKTFSVKVLFPA